MIRRALIVDTETTGLDPVTDRVIEIAALLYSVEQHTTLSQFATLLPGESNAAERVNRIPIAALGEVGRLEEIIKPVRETFHTLRSVADVIVCHNVEFDQQWFRSDWLDLPWVCTNFDFEWPMQTREAGSLINLALEHGIGISSAHRALTDCQLIASLFDRMPLFGCDLQAMFARAMRPKGIFQAVVPFEEKDRAKEAGFKWNGETKKWTRRMAVEDAGALPFKTVLLRAVA